MGLLGERKNNHFSLEQEEQVQRIAKNENFSGPSLARGFEKQKQVGAVYDINWKERKKHFFTGQSVSEAERGERLQWETG